MSEKKQTSFEAFAISENAGIAIGKDFVAEYAVDFDGQCRICSGVWLKIVDGVTETPKSLPGVLLNNTVIYFTHLNTLVCCTT